MIYPILHTWKPVAVKNAVCGPFADMFACIYGIFAKIEYYVSNKSLFRVKNIQNRPSAMVPCRGEGGRIERAARPRFVTLSGAGATPLSLRSRMGLLIKNLLCHFDRGKEQPRLTEWRNLARCVSAANAFPFHAFTLFKGEGGPLAVDEG